MPRRIEVELTSRRDDGIWTWRAAGARQPKGTLDGALLFDGAKVGDVLRAEAEFDVDGIDIVSVQAPKQEGRREPERIELLSSAPSDDQLVTTTLVPKGRGERGRGDDRGRKPRGRRPEGGDGGDRPRRERRPQGDATGDRERKPRGERKSRPTPPPVPDKPKPKRLRPLRHHRNAVLESLPEAERPIAEQVLRGGVPAVRQAVDKQNEQATAEGGPTIKADPLIAIAERLLPQLRTAEWRDRADAALKNLDELDLRDLRSVVVASDSAARDDETRELAATLREGLNRRVDEEHRAWLTELDETITAGRVVRALRLSSRPPKAGAPLPPELANKLAESAGAAFGPEATQERWATVLDAVAYSPVRQTVTPASFPAEPSDELLTAVRKLASRVPTIAAHFGIEATEGGRGRGPSKPRPPGAKPPVPAPPPQAEPTPPQAESTVPQAESTVPQAEPTPPQAESTVPQAEPAAESDPTPAEASAVAAEVAETVEEATGDQSEAAETAPEPDPADQDPSEST